MKIKCTIDHSTLKNPPSPGSYVNHTVLQALEQHGSALYWNGEYWIDPITKQKVGFQKRYWVCVDMRTIYLSKGLGIS